MTKQRQRLETLLLKLTRQEEELKRKICKDQGGEEHGDNRDGRCL